MNILAVATTGMGDSLLATPAISLLRSSFPQAHIELLTHKRWKDLFIYNPHIDACHGYSNNPFTRFKLRFVLRKHWDIIVVFHANGSEYLLLEKLNYTRIINNQGRVNPDKHIEAIEVPFDMHAAQRRNEVARAAGAQGEGPQKLELYLNNPPKKDSSRIRILLQPAAANIFKMWPVEYFAETVGRLHKKYQAEFFVIGGPKDTPLFTSIARKNPQATVHNATGNTLLTNIELINTADLFITNDTGPMHISHALGRPTLSLWCMTDPELIGPYNKEPFFEYIKVEPLQDIAERKEDRSNESMKQITVDMVMEKAEKLLAACQK